MHVNWQSTAQVFDKSNIQTFPGKENRSKDRKHERNWTELSALLKGTVLPSPLIDLAVSIAKNPSLPTLIYGETGTGKEEYAKFIHRLRCRENQDIPFIAVNCANLSGELTLSALFGHKKGAFTGAVQDATGYIAAAHGGILFLDEIHTLDKICQQRLLRVLNDGTYQRLGSTHDRQSDFQLICASTKDLDDAATNGEFLLDLWMRIIGFEVKIPALRERLQDMETLILCFLAKEKVNIPAADLQDLISHCQSFYWQGNIRQLFRCLKVFLALSYHEGAKVKIQHMPIYKSMYKPERPAPIESRQISHFPDKETIEKIIGPLFNDICLDKATADYEKLLIQASLYRHNSVSEAAQALGVPRSSFALKRQKFGLIEKTEKTGIAFTRPRK